MNQQPRESSLPTLFFKICQRSQAGGGADGRGRSRTPGDDSRLKDLQKQLEGALAESTSSLGCWHSVRGRASSGEGKANVWATLGQILANVSVNSVINHRTPHTVWPTFELHSGKKLILSNFGQHNGKRFKKSKTLQKEIEKKNP